MKKIAPCSKCIHKDRSLDRHEEPCWTCSVIGEPETWKLFEAFHPTVDEINKNPALFEQHMVLSTREKLEQILLEHSYCDCDLVMDDHAHIWRKESETLLTALIQAIKGYYKIGGK